MKNNFATTGTEWGNCSHGECIMPDPIEPNPNYHPGIWELAHTNVLHVSSANGITSLFFVWTWKRI